MLIFCIITAMWRGVHPFTLRALTWAYLSEYRKGYFKGGWQRRLHYHEIQREIGDYFLGTQVKGFCSSFNIIENSFINHINSLRGIFDGTISLIFSYFTSYHCKADIIFAYIINKCINSIHITIIFSIHEGILWVKQAPILISLITSLQFMFLFWDLQEEYYNSNDNWWTF